MNLVINFYQRFLSPISHLIGRSLFGSNYACRFSPTCSQYFSQATRKYGIIHGGFLGIKRILKCHPLSHANHFDPVP